MKRLLADDRAPSSPVISASIAITPVKRLIGQGRGWADDSPAGTFAGLGTGRAARGARLRLSGYRTGASVPTWAKGAPAPSQNSVTAPSQKHRNGFWKRSGASSDDIDAGSRRFQDSCSRQTASARAHNMAPRMPRRRIELHCKSERVGIREQVVVTAVDCWEEQAMPETVGRKAQGPRMRCSAGMDEEGVESLIGRPFTRGTVGSNAGGQERAVESSQVMEQITIRWIGITGEECFIPMGFMWIRAVRATDVTPRITRSLGQACNKTKFIRGKKALPGVIDPLADSAEFVASPTGRTSRRSTIIQLLSPSTQFGGDWSDYAGPKDEQLILAVPSPVFSPHTFAQSAADDGGSRQISRDNSGMVMGWYEWRTGYPELQRLQRDGDAAPRRSEAPRRRVPHLDRAPADSGVIRGARARRGLRTNHVAILTGCGTWECASSWVNCTFIVKLASLPQVPIENRRSSQERLSRVETSRTCDRGYANGRFSREVAQFQRVWRGGRRQPEGRPTTVTSSTSHPFAPSASFNAPSERRGGVSTDRDGLGTGMMIVEGSSERLRTVHVEGPQSNWPPALGFLCRYRRHLEKQTRHPEAVEPMHVAGRLGYTPGTLLERRLPLPIYTRYPRRRTKGQVPWPPEKVAVNLCGLPVGGMGEPRLVWWYPSVRLVKGMGRITTDLNMPTPLYPPSHCSPPSVHLLLTVSAEIVIGKTGVLIRVATDGLRPTVAIVADWTWIRSSVEFEIMAAARVATNYVLRRWMVGPRAFPFFGYDSASAAATVPLPDAWVNPNTDGQHLRGWSGSSR
ncbi:hypothetical protein B0H21DRAFT_705124 [Amylocystis lapponica]|nr:hypothetical protein B0H21DRAFT_705124 [Amylocystis lapponica]